MLHLTKTKGDLGVLKAQLDLTQKGYIVSWPMTEHAPFDLVITNLSGSRTVQVKTRSIDHSGGLEVRLASVWKNRRGVVRKEVNKLLVDLYCIFCPETDHCYYIRSVDVKKTIKLRVRIPKNGQRRNIKFAADYREVP
jgi:PD-(D/E)XK endonuclease